MPDVIVRLLPASGGGDRSDSVSLLKRLEQKQVRAVPWVDMSHFAGHPGAFYSPPLIEEIAMWIASGGAAAAAYELLRAWLEMKTGRSIKVSVDGIEVETTQLNQDEFLQLFERIRQFRDSQPALPSGPGSDPALQSRQNQRHRDFVAALQASGINAEFATFEDHRAEEDQRDLRGGLISGSEKDNDSSGASGVGGTKPAVSEKSADNKRA